MAHRPPAPSLSAYGEACLTTSPVNRMMAEFAVDFRDDVDINLGVGYVNEATLPRDGVRQGLDAVLQDPDHYRAALNYGGPTGSRNLLDSLRRWYLRHGTAGCPMASKSSGSSMPPSVSWPRPARGRPASSSALQPVLVIF